MVGAIANRVDGQTEPHLCSFSSILEELLAVHIENATIIFFADIRLEHRGRMRTKRAVHEDLDRADPKPVIAKACAEAQLICLVEQFHRDVLKHAELELSLFMKLLQRHEGIAAIEVVDARQAHLP